MIHIYIYINLSPYICIHIYISTYVRVSVFLAAAFGRVPGNWGDQKAICCTNFKFSNLARALYLGPGGSFQDFSEVSSNLVKLIVVLSCIYILYMSCIYVLYEYIYISIYLLLS